MNNEHSVKLTSETVFNCIKFNFNSYMTIICQCFTANEDYFDVVGNIREIRVFLYENGVFVPK